MPGPKCRKPVAHPRRPGRLGPRLFLPRRRLHCRPRRNPLARPPTFVRRHTSRLRARFGGGGSGGGVHRRRPETGAVQRGRPGGKAAPWAHPSRTGAGIGPGRWLLLPLLPDTNCGRRPFFQGDASGLRRRRRAGDVRLGRCPEGGHNRVGGGPRRSRQPPRRHRSARARARPCCPVVPLRRRRPVAAPSGCGGPAKGCQNRVCWAACEARAPCLTAGEGNRGAGCNRRSRRGLRGWPGPPGGKRRASAAAAGEVGARGGVCERIGADCAGRIHNRRTLRLQHARVRAGKSWPNRRLRVGGDLRGFHSFVVVAQRAPRGRRACRVRRLSGPCIVAVVGPTLRLCR
eukprot:scaffold20698_cov111-Isochrysis_galbana.AAC.5